MAHAKAALDALQIAFTQYKQSKSLLDKSLKATSKNERNIANKMSSLSAALSEINKCHTLWASKSGLTEEDLSSDEQKFNASWLEALWDEADDYQQQVDQVISDLKPANVIDEDQHIHVLREQFDSLKIDITSRLDTLLSATSPVTRNLSSPSLTIYDDILKGVQTSFSIDLNSAFKEIKDLDPTNLKTHCNEFEHFKRVIQPKILTIKCSSRSNIP